jgi:hypothetical protein
MLWLALRALFGVVMLALAGFGCGAWIANFLPATCNRIERVGISLLGGLGIFSLALFLIGQIPFSRTPMIPRDAFIPCLIVLLVLVLTAVAGNRGDHWGLECGRGCLSSLGAYSLVARRRHPAGSGQLHHGVSADS